MSDRKEDKDDRDEQKDNVWQQLLGKATSKTKEPNSTILVLGDKKSGKGNLLKKFSDRVFNPTSQEYLLDYSYCKVRNVHDQDPDEVRSHMNIWECETADHVELLAKFVENTGLDRLVYVITLDLSEPWELQSSLNKWLDILEKTHERLMAKLPADKQTALRNRISTFNQLYVDQSVKTSDIANEAGDAKVVDMSLPKRNLGVPLIVVGCKGDALTQVFSTQAGVGDRFEYISRHLRHRCLDYGATIMFTSAKDSANINILQEYIYHRLYGFENVHPARAVGTDQQYSIFIPSGYDTMALIAAIQPARASWAPEAAFVDVFKNPEEKKKSVKLKEDEEVTAQDSDTFFKTLKFRMEQGQFQPRPAGAVSAKAARMAAAAAAEAKQTADGLAMTPSAVEPTAAPAAAGGGGGAAPSASPPPEAEDAAKRKVSAAAPADRKVAQKDQKAVKDFFTHLLNATSKPDGSNRNRVLSEARKNAERVVKEDKA